MEFTFSLDTIDEAVSNFIQQLGERRVVALHGEMGAGKTTFISRVAQQLGTSSTTSSPTFSIINEYALPSNGKLFHIDLYRLKDHAEAIEAGVEDCMLSGSLCLIEWPEIAARILPEDTLHCYLQRVSEYQRKLRINL